MMLTIFLVLIDCLFFWDRISLITAWLHTCYVAEEDLGILILLSVLAKCWDYRHALWPRVYVALEMGPRASRMLLKYSFYLGHIPRPWLSFFACLFEFYFGFWRFYFMYFAWVYVCALCVGSAHGSQNHEPIGSPETEITDSCDPLSVIYLSYKKVIYKHTYMMQRFLLLSFYFLNLSLSLLCTGLWVSMYTRLTLNLEQSSCLCLVSAGIKNVCHTWLDFSFCFLRQGLTV